VVRELAPRIRELAPDTTGEGDAERERGDREHERGVAGDALDASAVLWRDLVPREEERSAGNERGSRDDDEREDPAVVRAHRAGLRVARDTRQRERDPERGNSDKSAEIGRAHV